MALQRDTLYPGRYNAPTPGQPQGGFKNRSAPGNLDGSYLDQAWLNDWSGFFSRLLAKAGITANGNADTALASQYFDGAEAIFKSGRKNAFVNGNTEIIQDGLGPFTPLNDEYPIDQFQYRTQPDGGVINNNSAQSVAFAAGSSGVEGNPKRFLL